MQFQFQVTWQWRRFQVNSLGALGTSESFDRRLACIKCMFLMHTQCQSFITGPGIYDCTGNAGSLIHRGSVK
jgi:hypothetical protein